MKETLSVVIPVRDSRPWIGELLESVRHQDVPRMEVVVVDNRSADGTAELVAEVASIDGRIRLIRSDATTAAQARNEGVAASTGEYLVFADADDIVPDGAYRTMMQSLAASRSDMVIGDHLKFSPTGTWSPTKRWGALDEQRTAVDPADAVALLSGRACWNRMFTRSFWDRAELRFPEIPSVDDIEPMTRAFVRAESIDVVPVPVYLYRDRSDGSSISQQADALTTLRYIEQEIACARLVAGRPEMRDQHALVVTDADGWAHVMRFVASDPVPGDTAIVGAALIELLACLPSTALETVAPVRRVLWALVLLGHWDTAGDFVRATDPRSDDVPARLDAWLAALVALHAADRSPVGVRDLVAQGLLPALVNGADQVSEEWIAAALPVARALPLPSDETGLRAAMVDAIRTDDIRAVAAVAALRRVVPLVVRSATPVMHGLEVGGTLPSAGDLPELTLWLRSDSRRLPVPIETTPTSWRATFPGEGLPPGRWTVSVSAAGITGEFPVVTARMALPPVARQFPIQPLADRKDGWRFLVDRRTPPAKGIAAVLARLRDSVR